MSATHAVPTTSAAESGKPAGLTTSRAMYATGAAQTMAPITAKFLR
jgi:hypothetical protein